MHQIQNIENIIPFKLDECKICLEKTTIVQIHQTCFMCLDCLKSHTEENLNLTGLTVRQNGTGMIDLYIRIQIQIQIQTLSFSI